jgi:Protein of unknown function (DUF3303)
MHFVLMLRARPRTLHKRTIRRLRWEYPEGLKVVGEYWLESDDPTAIVVLEADSTDVLTANTMAWEDVMDIEVFPTLKAEEGLDMLRQHLPSVYEGFQGEPSGHHFGASAL